MKLPKNIEEAKKDKTIFDKSEFEIDWGTHVENNYSWKQLSVQDDKNAFKEAMKYAKNNNMDFDTMFKRGMIKRIINKHSGKHPENQDYEGA